jgi:hypothetical protein
MFFSYVVARDYGFAPNPFNGLCTLATCKQDIRKSAKLNDWIFGCGAAALNCKGKLIYAMKVTNKISYNDYFTDTKYSFKKPIMNGSLKRMYGDNIYFFDKNNGAWKQLDSHHSNKDGSINYYNLHRDTKCEYLLLSDHFFYWGKNCIEVPEEFKSIIHFGIGYRSIKIDPTIAKGLIKWISSNYDQGYLGDPIQFDQKFQRYDGKS